MAKEGFHGKVLGNAFYVESSEKSTTPISAQAGGLSFSHNLRSKKMFLNMKRITKTQKYTRSNISFYL